MHMNSDTAAQRTRHCKQSPRTPFGHGPELRNITDIDIRMEQGSSDFLQHFIQKVIILGSEGEVSFKNQGDRKTQWFRRWTCLDMSSLRPPNCGDMWNSVDI